MSDTTHRAKEVHGSLTSYIIGFILSLFLTANAYYLVVSKSITGTALLITILVLAFLQMFVQIFFFLHLGRGPKPLYNIVFFVGTAGLILVVVVGSVFIMNNLQYNMSPTEVTKKLAQGEAIAQVGGKDTGACQKLGANHKVTLSKGRITPLTVKAQLCDTLSFINKDGKAHDIVFGQYPQPVNYGGESEIAIRKNYSKTVTLNQLGTFLFRDKLDPDMAGSFTVSE